MERGQRHYSNLEKEYLSLRQRFQSVSNQLRESAEQEDKEYILEMKTREISDLREENELLKSQNLSNREPQQEPVFHKSKDWDSLFTIS